ncbi:hypothetical protein ACN2WE_21375 [Streptomyces sp. cg28]|uniref:hypothetical protein n=1 Tax=Streptomyces sp. cg28 TaxID=3403457 RepID=UPI003B21C9CA
MTDLSTSTAVDNTTLPSLELDTAVRVAQKMLTAYGDTSRFDIAQYAQAYGAFTESIRLLLRAVGAEAGEGL